MRFSDYVPRNQPKPTSWVRVQVNGRVVYIGGKKTRIYTLDDLAKLWHPDTTKAIIWRWYRQEILPPPYMHKRGKGEVLQPLWIREQVRPIHEIINLHWTKFSKLRYTHKVTIRALLEHSEAARERFAYAIERLQDKERVSHVGVEWIDPGEGDYLTLDDPDYLYDDTD